MDYPISSVSFSGGEGSSSTYKPTADFSYLTPTSGDGMFLGSGIDSSFGDDAEFAATLAAYQPCHDCTPATKTTIPHHHHPSGRLAGASAQLDGHFCCSWLVHDQPCFLCFQSAEALDNHIKNDHAGKDGTYRCLWQDCSKQHNTTGEIGPVNFGNKPKLMRHVHSHTGYKPFPCPFPGCDKGFVTKEQLKNHETTHTKARKYKCAECGKAFAVKSALTTHITAVHEEKKIHACEVCGKAFADSSNLSKHKQTHYRDTNGRKQQRARRRTASTISACSSPSTIGPSTPHMHIPSLSHHFCQPTSGLPPGIMAPPAQPLHHHFAPSPLFPTSYYPLPMSATNTTTSTTSSPPPSDLLDFDPSCYCCEQPCPPPAGPATPCDEADECCQMDGFCDLPECLGDVCCDEAAVVPCCEESTAPPCCEEATAPPCPCDDALLPYQIEQLREFQPSAATVDQWDEFLVGHAGSDGASFATHG